jgi:RNA polymerase sigma-70 factor (ECF subfamily)
MNDDESRLAEEFEEHRAHLTRVAYRMLGSLAEAEDAVQETWLRWRGAAHDGGDAVRDPRAWLTTATGRICLDVLRSARVRRAAYVGPWLPEPLVERLPASGQAETADPADVAILDESVRIALLHLLERLGPEQRVAFVLHDVFGVPFDGVASTLGIRPDAARQHASRARRLLHTNAPEPLAPLPDQRVTIEAFLDACRGGDLDRLTALLAPGVELHSDGGGVVSAARRVVVGADNVARFALGVHGKWGELESELVLVNGQLGMTFRPERPANPAHPAFGVLIPDVGPDGRITRVSLVLNPEKLRHLR